MSARLLLAVAVVAAALVAPAGASSATFTVDLAGNGSGTVTSEPAGLSCTVTAGAETGACSAVFANPAQGDVKVLVTYTPAPGSLCAIGTPGTPEVDNPKDTPCLLTQQIGPDSANITIDGIFVLAKQNALTVSKTGEGSGKVTSSPVGIDCGPTCSKTFDPGTLVTLTATPDAGAVFKQWMGACNGQGATCTLTISQPTSTNAVFDLAGTTTTPTTPATPTTADSAVGADVIGAAAGRSRIGKRVARLELVLEEPVSAVLTLVRKGKTLATKRFARVKEGERVLTLTVPGGVAGGGAQLRFVLTDAAGNTLSGKRSVRIPAPR